MTELHINGRIFDAPKSIPEITRSIGSIGEIENRQGDYSTSIEIPLTGENLNISENSHIIGTDTDFPYILHAAKLKSGGHSIFENGLAFLDRYENDALYFSAFGSMVNLFKIWDSLPARNLFMPELDQPYLATFPIFENNIWENGVIPLYVWTDELAILPSPLLSIFCAYVFRKLFESQGYTVTGNIFSDANFTRAVITPVEYPPRYGQRYFDENFVEILGGGGSGSHSEFFTDNGNISVIISTVSTYVIPAGGTFEFLGEINFTSQYLDTVTSSLTGGARAGILKNGVEVTGLVDYVAGDVVDLVVIFDFIYQEDPLLFTPGGGTISAAWTSGRLFLNAVDSEIQLIEDVHCEQLLPPDWTQLDLFKNICKAFGIFVVVENTAMTANAFFFKEVYEKKLSAYDWTEKMSGKAERIDFHAVDYGKKNLFKYDDDQDVFREWSFEIFDASLQEEMTKIELDFAASTMRSDSITDVAEVYFILAGGEEVEPKPRLLFINRPPNSGSAPRGVFRLNFPDYYGFLENLMMKRYKRIKIWCKLTGSDVLSFDFSRPIFLQQFGEYFFVEKIDAYTTDHDLTAVEAVALGYE